MYELNFTAFLTEVEASLTEVEAFNFYTMEYEWTPLTEVEQGNGGYIVKGSKEVAGASNV